MKTAILCMACVVGLAGAARAETNWVGVGGGLSMPMGDFGDAANMGWHFGGTGTWMFNPTWGAGVDLNYHSWGGSDDFFIIDPAEEWSFSAMEAGAHAKFMFPSEGSIKPWLKGGLGIYNLTAKGEFMGVSADDSESEMGFNIGGGINIASKPTMAYGIGVAYHSIQTEGDATNMFTATLSLLFGVGGPQ